MAFYGYTVGDADNPGTFSVGFDVYRFIVPSVPVNGGNGTIATELVRTLTGANFTGDAGEDLEGLGTSQRTQKVNAISEGPGIGRRINSIDKGSTPATQNLTGTSRVFGEAGSDFYVNSAEVDTQYIVQGDQTIGSKLYKTGASGSFGNTTLTQVGTDAEFADGLAIYSRPVVPKRLNGQYTGEYIAFASDFALNDGDGEEIYAVNLNGGDFLGNPIRLVNPNGSDFDVLTDAAAVGKLDPDSPNDGFDCGLTFIPFWKWPLIPPDPFPEYGPQPDPWLIAQTENGIIYQITHFLDDALGSTTGDGKATIQRLGVLNLPGVYNGSIEYEGLTIVSENAAGSPIFNI